jgi:hypothetical protein
MVIRNSRKFRIIFGLLTRPGLRGGRAKLPVLAVFLTALFPHRDLLWIARPLPLALRSALGVMWFLLLPEGAVEVCHLFDELVPGLNELVEACPMLGIRGAVPVPHLWSCRRSPPGRQSTHM